MSTQTSYLSSILTLLCAIGFGATACGSNNTTTPSEEDMPDVVLFDEDMTSADGDMNDTEDMGAPEEDMTQPEDMNTPPADMGQEDMAMEEDMGGLPSDCDGDCATQDLTATYGATTEPFERAVYGLSAPETTASGEWEVYIEALHGGFDGCPAQDSPTPARTMILANLKASAMAGQTLTKDDDGLAVTLLDFDGSLFTEDQVFERADSVELTPQAGNLCVECVGMMMPSHMEGFIALDMSAMFPSGAASGHIYAVHCDSLDTAAP